MNKQSLFLNIFQATSDVCGGAAITPHLEFDLPLEVHVGRNSKNGAISHITLEFAGIRARFLCSILFNGSGPHDTCLANFHMPKRKLQSHQKAYVLLSCLDFLTSQGVVETSMADFCASVEADYTGPHAILPHFYALTAKSERYVEDHPELLRGVGMEQHHPSLNFSF